MMTKPLHRETCGDCGAMEGQLHLPGCDMERCPFCGGQLISCKCAHELLGKEPVPFILYPNVCAKCGALWPEMFSVPDEEWERWSEMLCKACYAQIKDWIEIERN